MRASLLLLVICVGVAQAGARKAPASKTVEITTSSDEARALYLKARDLSEKLRATDAHVLFEQAVAKDKDFALAYLGLAQTSGTTKAFFDALGKAVAVAGKASDGEQWTIRAVEAGAKADPVSQKEYLVKLVKAYPKDERVQTAMGAYHFARLDYKNAIASYEKAIAINPAFTTPYNQLGYSYRFTGKLANAEKTFKKYIELLPDDPNPHDSYAELLMELGKFDESIKSYEKALAIDPNFVASYVGIGNDYLFQGKTEDARKAFARLTKAARNDGERRQAMLWIAIAHAYDAAWDKAVAELEKMAAISSAARDWGNLANDYNLIAVMLLEGGRPDDALAKFKQQVETSDKSSVPDEVKAATRRNFLFDEGWVAVVKNDLTTAKAKAAEYGKAISKTRPAEVRQLHELNGMIAIAEKKWTVAIAELAQANPRDPRIFYLTAVAQQGAGDAKGAKKTAQKVVTFNSLALNLAFVRRKAAALIAAK